MKKIVGMLLVFVMALSLTAPSGVQAASAKTRVKRLVANMSSYEFYLIMDMGLRPDEGYEIVLDAEHKAQAAALAVSLAKAPVVESDENGLWSVYGITSSQMKKMTKKLFGKAVSYKKLPKSSPDKISDFLFAFRNSKGKPMIYCWEAETETDFVNRSVTISKSGNGYIVTKMIYCGYWGGNDGRTSNYVVTYKTAKSKTSAYGFEINYMHVKRLQ
ncbi:MAG: hypothetical protein ILP09_05160 [Oscillospiraceae bacterium]|nr:hypothetical protein [Oscillospiraceae bacterium]